MCHDAWFTRPDISSTSTLNVWPFTPYGLDVDQNLHEMGAMWAGRPLAKKNLADGTISKPLKSYLP